ncbi:MAG: hypothetical protein ACJ8C4_10135 [Gemmataceae bacterium]
MSIACDLLERHLQTLVADPARWQTLIADDIVWELAYAPRSATRRGCVAGTRWCVMWLGS